MTRTRALFWGIAVIAIALLNIVDVLPDWTTFAAILTAPLFLGAAACRQPRKDVQ